MAGETIVFFQKYTTLVGAAGPGGFVYTSDPYEVTPYKSVVLEVDFAGGTTGSGISAQLQGSSDLITWTDLLGAALTPAIGALASATETDTPRYVRVVITVTAAEDSVTLWAKAVCRES